MLKRWSLFALCGCLAMCAFAYTGEFLVNLDNSLDVPRVDVPVVISLTELLPGVDISCATVMDGDNVLACQLDDLDGDGRADELAFVVDVDANAAKSLTVTLSDVGEQAEYTPRVWADLLLRTPKKGENVRIREVTVPGDVNFYNMPYGHGPMFESELVGYRVYFNPKQTLDPYGKFQKRLELVDCMFYPTDEQLAQGFGDDVLLAGNSCGVGAFKGWVGNQATHIEPVKSRTMRLVSAGPVRTIVEAVADDWAYQGDKLDMLNRYTLYAGHRDVQVDVMFDRPLADQVFATGVERVKGNETVSWHDGEGLVASWGRHWPVNDTVKYAKETIGIATCVPRRYVRGYVEDPENFLYTVSAPGESALRYHTMFTSRKETFGYPDSEAWFAALPPWRRELESPLIVTVTPAD